MKGEKGNGHSFVLEKKLCVYNIIETKFLQLNGSSSVLHSLVGSKVCV